MCIYNNSQFLAYYVCIKINHEMRKCRHDYVNILSTLSDFIREEDMDGLRKYFRSEILPMQDSMQMNAIKINGLENLHIREIKGLLTSIIPIILLKLIVGISIFSIGSGTSILIRILFSCACNIFVVSSPLISRKLKCQRLI
jgi:hypothetical protein